MPFKNSIRRSRNGEKGSSILESLIAIIVLCWVFFGVMQIFHWGMSKLFCDYAAFYAAKAQSLGYAHRTIEKAARVAAIGTSGEDRSNPKLFSGLPLADRLALYMSTGNSNLDFSYWDVNDNTAPEFLVRLKNYGSPTSTTMIDAATEVRNLPMLNENWASMLQLGTSEITPKGSARMYNHAGDILQ